MFIPANNCDICQFERSKFFMDPIVSKIIKVTVGVAGLALCSLINSALKDEVSNLCDFDLDDF